MSRITESNTRPVAQPWERYFLVAVVFAILIFCVPKSATSVGPHATSHTPTQWQSSEETPWRYTRYGWQDSTDWKRTPSELPTRTIDHISPVLFSIDILLAVLAAMIWASDEWQVDCLFGRKQRRKNRVSFDHLERKARLRRQRSPKQ